MKIVGLFVLLLFAGVASAQTSHVSLYDMLDRCENQTTDYKRDCFGPLVSSTGNPMSFTFPLPRVDGDDPRQFDVANEVRADLGGASAYSGFLFASNDMDSAPGWRHIAMRDFKLEVQLSGGDGCAGTVTPPIVNWATVSREAVTMFPAGRVSFVLNDFCANLHGPGNPGHDPVDVADWFVYGIHPVIAYSHTGLGTVPVGGVTGLYWPAGAPAAVLQATAPNRLPPPPDGVIYLDGPETATALSCADSIGFTAGPELRSNGFSYFVFDMTPYTTCQVTSATLRLNIDPWTTGWTEGAGPVPAGPVRAPALQGWVYLALAGLLLLSGLYAAGHRKSS